MAGVNVATLVAKLEADIRDFEKDMKKADGRIGKLEKSTGKASKSMGGFGKAVKSAGLAIGAMQIARFVADTVQMAVAAEEAESAFRTTFGEALPEATKFVEEFATKAGFAQFELQQLLAVTGNIVQGLGGTEKESAELSETMARLAGDVASFSNAVGGAPAVLAALQSALTGEREALKTYGIVVSEAEVQTQAFAMTGKTAASELTKLDKALATVEVATQRAGKAIGDLDRTQDSAANQMRQLGAAWKDAQAELGAKLIPTLMNMIPLLKDLIGLMGLLADATAAVVEGNIVNSFQSLFTGGGGFVNKLPTDEVFESFIMGAVEAARAAKNVNNPLQKLVRQTELQARADDTARASAEALAEERLRLKKLAEETLEGQKARARFALGQLGRQELLRGIGFAIDPAGLAELRAFLRAGIDAKREFVKGMEQLAPAIEKAIGGVLEAIGGKQKDMDAALKALFQAAIDQTNLERNLRELTERGFGAVVEAIEKASPEVQAAYASEAVKQTDAYLASSNRGLRQAMILNAAALNPEGAMFDDVVRRWGAFGSRITTAFTATSPAGSGSGGGAGGGSNTPTDRRPGDISLMLDSNEIATAVRAQNRRDTLAGLQP